MQFQKLFKEGIRAGSITCSFRKWRSPQAKVGGRYNLHPVGAIEVTSVSLVAFSTIRDIDAQHSGFEDRSALARYLKVGENDEVYRVDLRYLGDKSVKQPARSKLSDSERINMRERLDRMDARSSRGPWTWRTLGLIRKHPGTRAATLAAEFGWETKAFKTNVRKLKQLGLTISLETGYQLAKRGEDLLSDQR
ncbi:MAG: hypothetical protein O7G86_20185 [Gammaproteobacteria bacterium]|nr:hypothetical protein [Gammaproteobacteria bacterium]